MRDRFVDHHEPDRAVGVARGREEDMPKSKTKKAPGEHEPIDFLATGFKVTTNCAFSVKILENFKLRSDHLASGA